MCVCVWFGCVLFGSIGIFRLWGSPKPVTFQLSISFNSLGRHRTTVGGLQCYHLRQTHEYFRPSFWGLWLYFYLVGCHLECIYDPGLRFPTPPNVMTLSTLPIAPVTIWRPPCCFEGELAEIEYRITSEISEHVWSLEYFFMPQQKAYSI